MSKTEHEECEATGKTSNENVSEVCNDTTTEKVVGIYGLRNKVNGKWYVGQSVDVLKRWARYSVCDCRKQRKLYNALKKYGYDNFEKVILEKCDSIEWILDYREMYWIRYLNSIKIGYNLTEGGSSGRKSSETRKKMSAWQIGKKHSEETKRKIGLKSLGRIHSESTRKKISQSGKKMWTDSMRKVVSDRFFGKPRTEEVRAKISATKKLNPHCCSPEELKRIGDRTRGTHLSDEIKAKISASSKGKPKSAEMRRKVSEKLVGRKLSVETIAKISRAALERSRLKKLIISSPSAVPLDKNIHGCDLSNLT
jgi:group I intron endonuclease